MATSNNPLTGQGFDVTDASTELIGPDVINDSFDSLRVGLEGVDSFLLKQWIDLDGRHHDLADPAPQQVSRRDSLGRLTNVSTADLQRLLNAAKKSAAQARRSFTSAQPYEFRFVPITGANPLNIPVGGFQLPLPPEKFDVLREQASRTFVAVNGVEYSLPGPQTLAGMTLEGMFPNTDPDKWASTGKPTYLPGYVNGSSYLKPVDLAGNFQALMKAGQPLQLTIGPSGGRGALKAGGGLVGVMLVTIVSFQYGEAFGHPGDYVFSMALKEWRPILPNPKVSAFQDQATAQANLSSSLAALKGPAAPTTPVGIAPPTPATGSGTGGTKSGSGAGIGFVPPNTPGPKPPSPALTNHSPATLPDVGVYVVKAGDSLFDIAARLLGTGTRWNEIYAANAKLIDETAKKHGASSYPRGWSLWPGTKLVIPPKGQRASG